MVCASAQPRSRLRVPAGGNSLRLLSESVPLVQPISLFGRGRWMVWRLLAPLSVRTQTLKSKPLSSTELVVATLLSLALALPVAAREAAAGYGPRGSKIRIVAARWSRAIMGSCSESFPARGRKCVFVPTVLHPNDNRPTRRIAPRAIAPRSH